MLKNLAKQFNKFIREALQRGDLDTACALIDAALDLAEEIVKLTPTEKDDEVVAKLRTIADFICGSDDE